MPYIFLAQSRQQTVVLCTLKLFADDNGAIFVTFVKDNATMSSVRYFENHVSYLVQNRRK